MSRLSEPVILSQPIRREGEEPITQVRLTRPMAGQLRGLTISDILKMDVTTMLTLLPRITKPTLDEREVEVLPPRDLVQLSRETVIFFVTSSDAEEIGAEAPASPTT